METIGFLGAGMVYGAYKVYNNKKEKQAKKNDPQLIFPTNDQQDDARVLKIRKRVILGRLVYAMYDRFKGKPVKEYQEWWTKVHYHLVPLESVLTTDELNLYKTELKNERENKYFGVFRRNEGSPSAEAPDWVVAIRGTHIKALADLLNDYKIVVEKLHSSNMIPLLQAVVCRLGAQHGYCNVNVTGHSLGAAAGLLVCRRLALQGCLVEGHFFNPPFATLESMARTCSHVVKHAIEAFPGKGEKLLHAGKRLGKKFLHHVVTDAAVDIERRRQALAEFKTLAEANWSPYLYVNKYDFICSKFLSHFRKAIHGSVDENQKKWYSSVRRGETESFHLFPCAHLVSIEIYQIRPISAHKLWNWMDPHVSYEFMQAKLIPWPLT
ncbi:hypothetical protein MPTK1_2g18580 [Marchantia polymorpha subsp. ruderalis]|nr:hypothetical protein MARPO_0137s0023 [Marchantia polymorpha]BBN02840.1 hypothetical protein Mp_2g18580 [Marchantia polymorpha subsp. ruderalis]|eukprot:PTQ29655.1 hypothetical protein MARPO_0137s0023 [Marchantia polymorpha]